MTQPDPAPTPWRRRRILRRALKWTGATVAVVAVGGFAFTRTAPFGADAEGERMERVESSPHWSERAFRTAQPLWIDFWGALTASSGELTRA